MAVTMKKGVGFDATGLQSGGNGVTFRGNLLTYK
jgi:hypothetical protein